MSEQGKGKDAQGQNARRIFDFLSLTPESMDMVTWLFGPWGIPADYREMRGYGRRVAEGLGRQTREQPMAETADAR